MKSIALILAVFVIATGFGYVYKHAATNSAPSSVSNADDMAVRQVVEAFGKQMQKVSLLAPSDERKEEVDDAYGAYVAPELLASWYAEGSDAPGRSTSSPWPDHINVIAVHQEGDAHYIVEGNVIEVANGAGGTTSPAAVYPATLTLEKRGSTWLITHISKGAYSELPQQITITGTWECLPQKNTSGPQTDECAFGIAKDASDGHVAIDTQ